MNYNYMDRLEGCILSEIGHAQKENYFVIFLLCGIKKNGSIFRKEE